MSVEPAELARLQREFLHLHRMQHQKIVDSLGLYYGQPMLLMILYDNGEISQNEIAKILCNSAASVAVSLRRMESRGLIIRRPDPNDMRSNKVCLSKKGKETAEKCRDGFEAADDRCFNGFSPEDMETLKRLYNRMIDNLK